jgi:hypothetical protein
MSDTVMIPWYATGFRANGFEAVLNEVAAIAMRYGATSYAVYRSSEDRYRYQQIATFESHTDWERYWEGPEMITFRARHSGWYQVPVIYSWWTLTAAGSIAGHAVPDTPAAGGIAAPAGNGAQTA